MTTTAHASTTLPVDEVHTTPQALRRAAELWPDGEALADVQSGEDVRWTWTELAEQVRAFAAALIEGGLQPGERVLVWAPNTRHWVVAGLGIQYAGGVLVPANTRYTGTEALELVERTNAPVAVVAGEFLGAERISQLTEAAGGSLDGTPLKVVVRVPLGGTETATSDVINEWDAFLEKATGTSLAEAERRADAVSGDDVADILFTSGTTGKSKGVVALHRHTLYAARVWGANGELSEQDRYLVLNPFFHSFGYKAGFLVCTLFGARIVPLAVYKPDATMELVQSERITVLPGAPTIFSTLLDAPNRAEFDLSSLRLAVTGAAIVPVVLVERMQSDLGLDTVVTAYGLTETSGMVTTCRPDDADEIVAGTCGRPFDGVEVKIADSGEVLTRSPMVMAGYLDDPENTAKTIDPDGWLHTGDVGELDPQGNLRITDRLKDMYISGGFNVYPAEIEQTLARLGGVADSAVIGISDDRLGEVGKAFIQRSTDAEGKALTIETVADFLVDKLAGFKRPREIEIVDALPRNAMGKVVKPDLRGR
ncbi:FadD3 family acyl-CoA ligase [Dietzia timorensis]|uniref:Putative acyl-CoA synthetase YngI n=1 Tax=Dietzia timorensis TaxID=499555 RepID=A0A173LIA6_9ACTN|nr:FadD3 family acyl-CoA ligase [Dietzia timorensis]ANI91519.1 Putative acyl-CoA synthetase YngI [Dietzia timorensis]